MSDDGQKQRKRHSIRVETQGSPLLTRVYMDGEELRGVYAVRIDIDARLRQRDVFVTLVLKPHELLIEGEQVVIVQESEVKS